MTERDSASRLFRNARREARVVMIVWALALVWSVGVCYLRGYEHTADSWAVQVGLASVQHAQDMGTFFGMPDWVWLGIVLPWLLCSAFTAGFCVGMADDDLGTEADEGARHHGH